ncbi:MAG: DUF2262 domain-containing protein [Bacteroidetes bacterium]|nr:DUF2262 domain-containing protein [Bacteroidota bacterium]
MSRQWTIGDFQREFEETEKWTSSTYSSGVKLCDRAVQIQISLENCEVNNQAEYIADIANKHINWVVDNIETIRTHVANKMTSLANDWLQEGESEMSENDFKERAFLDVIKISATGEFDHNVPIEDGNLVLYFDDDDIFGGHTIQVWIDKGYVLDEDPTLMG